MNDERNIRRNCLCSCTCSVVNGLNVNREEMTKKIGRQKFLEIKWRKLLVNDKKKVVGNFKEMINKLFRR